MKECRQIQKQFDLRLDGRLGFAHELAFDEHVATCATCRQRWHQYVDAWQTVGRLPSVEPSVGFVERTLRRLEEQTAHEPASAGWPMWRWALVGAAVVALSVTAGLAWWRVEKTRQLTAVYNEVLQADYLEDFDVVASLDKLNGEEGQL